MQEIYRFVKYGSVLWKKSQLIVSSNKIVVVIVICSKARLFPLSVELTDENINKWKLLKLCIVRSMFTAMNQSTWLLCSRSITLAQLLPLADELKRYECCAFSSDKLFSLSTPYTYCYYKTVSFLMSISMKRHKYNVYLSVLRLEVAQYP